MLDLRDLFLLIKEQKKINANFSLEFDCVIDTDDPKSLVKVINYIINYLTQLTDKTLEISVNQQMGRIVIGFSVFADQHELPPLSDQLEDALKPYNATFELKHKEGEFIQILITFI